MASSPAERRRNGHLLAAGERISLSGDLKAMLWLRGACLDYLDGMPTTMDEDQVFLECCDAEKSKGMLAEEKKLHPEHAGQNYGIALQWRMCQKRLVRLQQYLA